MAVKASDNIRYFHNAGGPTITTVTRPVIEENGLYFKDIDGTGKVSPVNGWRLSPEERAAAYVKEPAVDESGVCISPNDVPGFGKDPYMPDSLKDENGKAYAYRDAKGNCYELNFGLNCE